MVSGCSIATSLLRTRPLQVDIVKRSEAGMVSDPRDHPPDATLAEVDALCGRYKVSGLPVVDGDGTLLGIVTNRDLRFETDRTSPRPGPCSSS